MRRPLLRHRIFGFVHKLSAEGTSEPKAEHVVKAIIVSESWTAR